MGQNRCCRCLLDDKIPESVFPGGKLIYYAFCQICSSTESQLIFFEQFSHTSAWQGLSFSILLLKICLAIFRSLRVAPCLRSVRLDDWLGVGIGASSAHCKTLALKILKNTKWSWWTVSQLFKAINILWPRCWKNEVNKWEWRENKDARIISVIVIMASDDHCRMKKVSDFIKSSAALTSLFLIQLDNCDFEAEEIVNGSLN